MTVSTDEMATSRQHAVPQRPRDSATLILLRRPPGDGPVRILMGKRHQRHSFMPDKYVFPGGRRDPADARMPVASGLSVHDERRLMQHMRGGPTTPLKAQAIALAAVRETFEETGLIFGRSAERPVKAPAGAWRDFAGLGYLPDLSGLCFFARAITPPGRTRRFDSRFFVADAAGIANPDDPVRVSEAELLDLAWVTFREAEALDLPSITRDILARLETALAASGGGLPGAAFVPDLQHMRGKNWVCDPLLP